MRKIFITVVSCGLMMALPLAVHSQQMASIDVAPNNSLESTSGLADKTQPSVLAAASDPIGEDWQVQWMVVAGGGNTFNGSTSSLGGTIGQMAVGSVTGADKTLHQGFWQTFVSSDYCCDLRADIDHDGVGPQITDLIYLVKYMFHEGDAPVCMDEADVDGDGEIVIIDDLIYMVSYMFQGGSPPAPCYPSGA